jgi:hypothetical protein
MGRHHYATGVLIMADYALNVDWRATAIAASGNQVPSMMGTVNDWLSTVLTDTRINGGQQNIDIPALTVRTWDANLTYYKMRGMDQVTAGVYATWVVTGQPDFTAARYVNTGSLNLPLRDVCVVDIWSG